MARGVVVALLATALLGGACTGRSPLSPSQEAQQEAQTGIVVRALSQDGEAPIAGASVLVDGIGVGVTGEAGEVRVTVTRDREIIVQVLAEGYQPSETIGHQVTGNQERWTFYLWR